MVSDNTSAAYGPTIQSRQTMPPDKKIKRDRFIKTCSLTGLFLPLVSCSSVEKTETGTATKFRLLDHPRHQRDFGDVRSKKIIFLCNCILNMNARMHGCARFFPAANKPILQFCLDNDLGMAQMPCPELLVTGLGRDRDEPEVEYLRTALEMPVSRERIRRLAEQVVFEMKEYRFQGFRMIAVLGNDGSPTCGVERTAFPDPENRFGPGRGVFIQELQSLMKDAGIEVPFKGVDDDKAEETVTWLKEIMEQKD